jgi:ribosomal protein L22
MTKPGDPQKGKAAEEEQIEAAAEEAKQATAQQDADEASAEAPAAEAKPKPKRTRAKKAEATAAAETGVGKDEAEAALAGADVETAEKAPADEPVEEQAKPKARSRRRKATDEAEAQETPKPAAKPAPSTNGRPLVKANAKYVKTSARKARLVCDHIRGKSVNEARAILAHTPRAVAEDWAKLLESAVANAEHNHELLGDDLRIHAVTADEGPTLKRYRPRAMGRATRIRKRTAHLSIALTPKEQ